ncbi:MAG: MFS transporter, partial [Sulfolobaceae archaeon]
IAVTLNGFAPNFELFLAFRTLQGLGLSMFPLAFSLIREEFPPYLVPRAQGIVSAMFGVGAAISLPIAAYIAQNLGWEANYHVVIPFVLILTFLVYREIRESRYTNPNVKIDYIGMGILALSLALLTIAVSKAPDWGWTSINFVLTIITGIVLFTIFLYYESKISNPLLPISELKNRNVFVANLAAFVAGFAIFMPFQALTFLFELPNPIGFNLTILQTGIIMLPVSFGQMIGAFTTARMITRTGTRPILILASILLSIFNYLVGIVTLNGASASIESIVILVFMSMIASAMLNVTLVNVLTFSIDRRKLGIMTGMNTVFRLIGGSFGPAVAGSILSTYYTYLVYPFTYNGQVIYIVNKLPQDYAFYFTFLIASIIALFMIVIGAFSKNIKIVGGRVINEALEDPKNNNSR